ncbi:diguanylate cyclase [Gorillibacterium massiliense]|uniref:diguanylate cyclase n=1 Tax=Gorillibacterium massiliense TaxID=1280390 RepID=UPI0004B3C160|nr:diguanylate cyclase [Gorillibacterium massiliense]
MRRDKGSLFSDIAFLLLLLFCFVCIVFVAGDSDHYFLNIILLNVAFLLAVVTFFTSATTGLVLNILFIFGYGTYSLYRIVVTGATIGADSYFWLIMTPILTVIAWMLTRSNRQLQDENNRLREKNASLVMVDENTRLKNMRSFQSDATVFMAISTRYKIPLTLLVLSVKYWDDLKRIVSETELIDIIADVTKINESSIRTNDSLYMLNPSVPLWGMLLLTDREGAEVVVNRLRDKVSAINMSEIEDKYKVELGLNIGTSEYKSDVHPSPLEWVSLAKKQMEFDV